MEVHLAIADSANDQHGYEFWLSVGRLAEKARLSERAARNSLRELHASGFLALLSAADGRPGVTSRYRFLFPDVPVVFESRWVPDEPREGGHDVPREGGQHVPRGHDVPGTGANDGRERGQHDPGTGAGRAPKTKGQPKADPKKQTKSQAQAPDTVRLCNILADLIEENGSRRPRITTDWITECDRLMRLDGHSADQVERAIRWCQADTFWRANVLSMPKLRAKYETLRLQAKRESGNANGHDAVPAGVAALQEWHRRRTEAAG